MTPLFFGSSERIKEANPRINSLADIMHGLGTTLIGSVIAILIWIYIHFEFSGEFQSRCLYAIPFLISFFHFVNYRRVVKEFQSVFYIITSNELQREFSEHENSPIIINVEQTKKEKDAEQSHG